jgi:hypothetical protein
MKRILLSGAAMLLIATPAMAMKITNLDSVDHRVLFTAAGVSQTRDIAAGDTEYFPAQPNGTLSLLSAEHPQPSQGTLHADGVLSGIVGAERTENIPTDSDDNYAIWPGGHLSIQQRMKMNQQGR